MAHGDLDAAVARAALLGGVARDRVIVALFERLLELCNDVGLLSEEYDPQAERLVGNFPQAFSHVGLVDSAMVLSREERAPTEERTSAAVPQALAG
jgi:GH15 family glucan-1,4-alpha-glucosidase